MSVDHGAAFVDTNVLVYSLVRDHPAKHAAARQLLSTLIDEDRLRVSTQVLQELFVTLTRKTRQRCSAEEALQYLDDLTAWPLVIVDYPAIREAAQLSRDAVLSFWDALIVVAARRSGASTLYSEDLNTGQQILGVEIVNPFRKRP
jgi:predicted nucleic acid-binding protein